MVMFFKAQICHPDHFLTFSKTIRTFTTHARLFVMRITKRHMFFIATQFYTKGTCMLYAELPADGLCGDFTMQGVKGLNSDNEEIYLELEGEAALHALKDWRFFKTESGRIMSSSKSLTIKLTRQQNQAVLSFEIATQNDSGSLRFVNHYVPVSIISRNKWSDYAEPSVEHVQVNVTLPSAAVLKNLVTRMRCIASRIQVSGSTAGNLDFRAETTSGAVTSSLGELSVLKRPNPPREAGDALPSPPDAADDSGAAIIDVGILHQQLMAFATDLSIISLNIENDKKVGLVILHHNLRVQCVFPHFHSIA